MRSVIGTTSSEGKKPAVPTIGSATAGDSQVTVAFTESTYRGKNNAGTYRATAGAVSGTCSAPCSSIVIGGLVNGTQYCFTIVLETPYGVNSDASQSACATPFVTPVTPPVTPQNCPPAGYPTGDPPYSGCSRSPGTICASGSLYGPGGANYDPIGFTCSGQTSFMYYCAGCVGYEGGYFGQLRDGCCGYSAPVSPPVGPVDPPVGPVVEPPVGPVSPCAGNQCTLFITDTQACTDACGYAGNQTVEYYLPSIPGCECSSVLGPCVSSPSCGAPSNNGEGASGGNGWNWVQKHTYIPTQGGVCTDTSLFQGSIWYEYSKCGCSNYNLFIVCIPNDPAPVTPPVSPVTPPVDPVTPPVDPVTPPVDPVTPPVSPVIDCSACGGGPGMCLTIKGETGCI